MTANEIIEALTTLVPSGAGVISQMESIKEIRVHPDDYMELLEDQGKDPGDNWEYIVIPVGGTSLIVVPWRGDTIGSSVKDYRTFEVVHGFDIKLPDTHTGFLLQGPVNGDLYDG